MKHGRDGGDFRVLRFDLRLAPRKSSLTFHQIIAEIRGFYHSNRKNQLFHFYFAPDWPTSSYGGETSGWIQLCPNRENSLFRTFWCVSQKYGKTYFWIFDIMLPEVSWSRKNGLEKLQKCGLWLISLRVSSTWNFCTFFSHQFWNKVGEMTENERVHHIRDRK